MSDLRNIHGSSSADVPDSPSSNSTSDVFHDTASLSGRDIEDQAGLEHESFFDAEDLSPEAQHAEEAPRESVPAASVPEAEPLTVSQATEIEEIPSQVADGVTSLQERKDAAEQFKRKSNELFAAGQFAAAEDGYSQALEVAHEDEPSRAVYFANRAACRLKLNRLEEAAQDCTSATDIDQGYLKAWIRRSTAYEQLHQYERALGDARKVLELDPGNPSAQHNVKRLTPLAQQEQERMKEEMIGKLKDLGNNVLGKFGMSLDNFKAVKDPNTGSYSINFNQG